MLCLVYFNYNHILQCVQNVSAKELLQMSYRLTPCMVKSKKAINKVIIIGSKILIEIIRLNKHSHQIYLFPFTYRLFGSFFRLHIAQIMLHNLQKATLQQL